MKRREPTMDEWIERELARLVERIQRSADRVNAPRVSVRDAEGHPLAGQVLHFTGLPPGRPN